MAAEQSAAPAPHREHVELHQCAHDNLWYLRHALSHECCQVPSDFVAGSHVDLIFDDEGFGFLAHADPDRDMVDVMDIFQREVLKTPSGEVAIDFGTEAEPDIKWLHNLNLDYQRVALQTTALGQHSAKASFELAFYRGRRRECGSRLLWAWPGLVKAFQGSAKWAVGDWLRKKWDRWERLLAQRTHCGEIMKAQLYTHEAQTLDSSRNLPWRAGSTVAVLVVLARLAHSGREAGGVEDDALRARITALLQALLGVLTRAPDWTMHLCMDAHAHVKPWPCLPQGRVPLACPVVAGVVWWPACGDRAWDRAAPKAWLELGRVAPGGANRLPDLIAALAEAGAKVAPFLVQILSQVGRAVDNCVVDGVLTDAGRALLAPTWTVSGIDCFSAPCSGDLKLENDLRRHVVSFKAACPTNLPFLSWAPDKSRVGNLALLNTPIVLPTNIAFPAPPQVRSTKNKSTAFWCDGSHFQWIATVPLDL